VGKQKGGKAMKLEDQVCSLEYAKRLKELDVKQDSVFCWKNDDEFCKSCSKWKITPFEKVKYQNKYQIYSAYTVAELGEMLPIYVTSEKTNKHEFFVRSEDAVYNTLENTEVDARAKMLIYLIENGLIEKK